MLRTGSLEEITDEDWDLTYNTNLKSMLYVCQNLIDMLKDSNGVILNTSSNVGLQSYITGRKSYMYASSKAAVIQFTKHLAHNYAPEVRVNCLCPGVTITNIFTNRDFSRFKGCNLLDRMAEPREICAEDQRVKAIFNAKNFGQFNSPYYGLIHTSGDCTIALCADFQDPVELIPEFVREWEKGFKIVIGRKTKSQENGLVYFLRGCYYKLIRKMSSVEMIEQFTGFGLYDRSFINTLRDLKDPTPFIRGIVAELGPERKEIEHTQPQRRAGKTHNNWYSLFDAAMLRFTSYTKVGMRIAEFVGFTIAALSFLIGLIYLIAKLVNWYGFTAGYAPTMIAIFFMGGVQLAFMGFLGEYIMAMNARIMNRPLVVEECRLNFETESDKDTEGELAAL